MFDFDELDAAEQLDEAKSQEREPSSAAPPTADAASVAAVPQACEASVPTRAEPLFAAGTASTADAAVAPSRSGDDVQAAPATLPDSPEDGATSAEARQQTPSEVAPRAPAAGASEAAPEPAGVASHAVTNLTSVEGVAAAASAPESCKAADASRGDDATPALGSLPSMSTAGSPATSLATASLEACAPSSSSSPTSGSTVLSGSTPPSLPPASDLFAVGSYCETVSKVLMREGETMSSHHVGYIPAGRLLEVLKVGQGRRLQVFEESGIEGWVSFAKQSGDQLLQSKVITQSRRDQFKESCARSQQEKLAQKQRPSSSQGMGPCDKCDGPHATSCCPFFPKERDNHKDAFANRGKKGPAQQLGGNGGNFVLNSAKCRVVPQPGDGSCLFHSLCFGLSHGRPCSGEADMLRRELMDFMLRHPKLEIAGDTLEEWVRWDKNFSISEYTTTMSHGGWGGGMEMACCSILKKVNVHVYEKESRLGGGYKRISCFDSPGAMTAQTVHVLYQGRMHYDALLVN